MTNGILKNIFWARFKRTIRLMSLACLFYSLPGLASGPVQVLTDHSVSSYLESDIESSIFVTALKHSGQWNSLEESNGLTLFVPTNESLRNEGSAFLLEVVLKKIENKERLEQLLALHIFTDNVPVEKTVDQQFVVPVSIGGCLDITVNSGAIKVGPEAQVTRTVKTKHGIIYYVDHLLWLPYKDQRSCI